MLMRYLIPLLLALAATLPAADWTTVDPIVVGSPRVVEVNDRPVIEVRVRFSDDAANVREKTYRVSGPGAATALARRVYDDRATLQSWETLKGVTSITPQAPTQAEAAIEAMEGARDQLDALARMQAAVGAADGDEVGSSGLTYAQARANLRASLLADVTTQARLLVALGAY